MTKYKLFKIGSLFLAAIVTVSCAGHEHADLQEYVKRVKAKKAGNIKPLPEIKPYETFTYNAKDLRDPFTPFVQEALEQAPVNTGLRPDANRKREALEQFPLDSLVFVGNLEKDGQLWGLISAPDSTVYKVKKGNYVGQNYGEIQKITENEILIKEIISDGSGGWIEREASLTLATE